jgi:hypothetical protein
MPNEDGTKTQAELDAEAAALAAEHHEETAEEKAAREAAEAAAETPEQKVEREKKEAEAKVNRRFSDLTRREQAALRRAEDAERTAALVLEMAQRTKPPEKKADDDPKPAAPKLADFENPEKFSEALVAYTETLSDWKVRQSLKSHATEQTRADTERRNREDLERIESDYVGHRAKALEDLPDFEEIAENPDLTVTPSMAFAMKSMGALAPKILYELGKTPAEAARIARLSPALQIAEIGVIRGRLESATKSKPNPLPAPIKPVGAARSTSKGVDEMSMDEYASHRNAQIKESRKRA